MSRKSLLYRLFGIGRIPGKVLPALQAERILILEEGLSGSLILKKFRSPGRRCTYRREWFSGSFGITGKRLIACTFSRCQINIGLEDPRLEKITVKTIVPGKLSIAFEAADFDERSRGSVELRFKTEKADQFCRILEQFK